jgi:hypothetical protein
MLFLPHRKHAYKPPWLVTGIALFLICRWCSFLTENTPIGLHACYGDSFTFHCTPGPAHLTSRSSVPSFRTPPQLSLPFLTPSNPFLPKGFTAPSALFMPHVSALRRICEVASVSMEKANFHWTPFKHISTRLGCFHITVLYDVLKYISCSFMLVFSWKPA